ncbi:phosphoglycerate mutase (2,3-diphosphoglycerate-independent) [Malassezia cuniculi]|uniref:Phosphoglycerate mutase (2,3-diphosphoglycerate-independent) n=1 Tax=Malassezia cuniculi TaxID=948313 RepID=A0AAF0ERY1_9BASI|nr:phosphoglycerate mutase (2,3-diphosphoglycerate-independent) [Malassezia cuniculi]
MRVILVRHGETNENVQGIIQGRLDTSLNEKGIMQAEQTADALRSVRVTHIISSPLSRARVTAEIIAKQQASAAFSTDERLQERGFGVLEGKVYSGPREKPADTVGIEPSAAVIARLGEFWEDLTRSPDPDRTVAIVSHGGALSSLMNYVLTNDRVKCAAGVEPSRFWNCSLSEINVPTEGPGTVISWADVRHLHAGESHVRNVDEAIS